MKECMGVCAKGGGKSDEENLSEKVVCRADEAAHCRTIYWQVEQY